MIFLAALAIILLAMSAGLLTHALGGHGLMREPEPETTAGAVAREGGKA